MKPVARVERSSHETRATIPRFFAYTEPVMNKPVVTPAGTDNKSESLLRHSAETIHAAELEALIKEDDRARPAQWRLSPQAVVTYLMGGKTKSGIEIAPKYIGNRRLIETAVATLATDRALLILGVPGTAKSWVSEHLAAAVTGSSQLIVQCTAGTDENQSAMAGTMRNSWPRGPRAKHSSQRL